MFDKMTLDVIDVLDGIQPFARQEGERDFAPLRKAIAALHGTATELQQHAFGATDPSSREQFSVLAHGFAAAADTCERLLPA